jgi:hypothetical protein
MSAAAWLAAAAPFIALVAGIAVVIAILQDLYVWFKGGDSVLKDLYYSARYWLTEKIGEAIDWLSDKFSKIGEALTSGFKIAIDWIDEKIKWIQTKIVESYRDMQELLGLGPKAGEGWENTAGQDRAEEKRRQARAEETARKMDAFRQKAVFAANAPMAAPTTGPLSAGLGPTVEAPMSITITGAGDPQATAQAVGAEVRKHLDATARKIQAGARK